jgi:hypothetical protein
MKTMLLVVAALIAVVTLPSSASAETCSDYATQADAQRAADTRDADGDGIYCESLPCPCLKSGTNSTPPSAPAPPSPPASQGFSPGRSISFGNRTRTSGCRIRGPLPDPQCTPGAYFKNADRSHICKPGYTKTVRNVSAALKQRVYAEYGITRHSRGSYEVDHLVPLELGGSNSITNLFPEAATPRPGFHEKDRLENMTHDAVCSRARALRATRRSIGQELDCSLQRLLRLRRRHCDGGEGSGQGPGGLDVSCVGVPWRY